MSPGESRLLGPAPGARRPARWWSVWLLVMVIMVVVAPLGVALGNVVLDGPASTDPRYPFVGAFGSLFMLLALWLWVWLKEGRALASVGFLPLRSWPRLLAGFGIGAGMMTAGVGLGFLLGAYGVRESPPTVTGVDAVPWLVPLILLALFQPGCQAALVPGYLLQTSVRQLPAWLAVVGTSILVAVLASLDPLSLLNHFLFALFVALLALQQGSLWLVVGIEAGWFSLRSFVFGLPMGGISAPTALFTIGPVPGAPTFVGGGPFGPETGLLATAVLAPAVVVAYVLLRRADRVRPATTPTREELTHAAPPQ